MRPSATRTSRAPSTSVLADRLRTLERAAVVTREPGPVGGGATRATIRCDLCGRYPPRAARPVPARHRRGANHPALHRRQAAPRTRPHPDPELTVRTTKDFLDRWASGQATWDDGRASGEVTTEGPEQAWPRWLAATGYLLRVEPETTNA
jgi:hypothetical protein